MWKYFFYPQEEITFASKKLCIMDIKIWDSRNRQWLEPMAIYFGKENTIWKIDAVKVGEDPLSDGWYDIQGEDLKKIAVIGDINHNVHLVENEKKKK
jgi:hypothetical protein